MNRSISIILEKLSSGNLRATGRHNGATVYWCDGPDAATLLDKALRQTAPAHMLPDGSWDLRYIETNGAAAQVIDEMQQAREAAEEPRAPFIRQAIAALA